MSTLEIRTVVFFGAGNLASHLALALVKQNISVIQVYNRTPEHGIKLAEKTGAEYISRIENITSDADLYFLTVTDSILTEFTSKILLNDSLMVHTSGSLDMDILAHVSSRYGVFYPLQTFSGRKSISFRHIPICIEAKHKHDQDILSGLAYLLTNEVFLINSEKRRWLHMAAVFAGNFPHFMYTIAEDLLREKEIPFDLLKPLIRQVALNAQHENLFPLQTGPAIREDSNILDKHRALLENYPGYLEIYNLISNSIMCYKKQYGKL